MGRTTAGAREVVVCQTNKSTKAWSSAPMCSQSRARFLALVTFNLRSESSHLKNKHGVVLQKGEKNSMFEVSRELNVRHAEKKGEEIV